VSLTAQQPGNNVVRTAVQALAAVLGGAQSLHTNALDEALALPTEDAALLALRTQQILAHETGLAEMVDPLGGSYCIERLTADLEAEAHRQFEVIDAMGGMVAAIEAGYPQREIADSAYRTSRRWRARPERLSGSTRSSPPRTSRWKRCTSTRRSSTSSGQRSMSCAARGTRPGFRPRSTR
jgi:methylmalonyl-CoA mutase N-terminal domain/subunit